MLNLLSVTDRGLQLRRTFDAWQCSVMRMRSETHRGTDRQTEGRTDSRTVQCCVGESENCVRCSDASIYRKYRFDIDISYRILSPEEISKFSIYTGIDFLILCIYHLAEFSCVMSRSREIFIETFFETFTDSESFNENLVQEGWLPPTKRASAAKIN